MTLQANGSGLGRRLRKEWRHHATPASIPAVAAGLATGLPVVLVGAYFGWLDYGLISLLGGWLFRTCLTRRCTTAWLC
jgi:hypothetical protein